MWTHSIPAPDFSEDVVQSVDWADAFVLSQAGDDPFSPSSSMDDSAYVSLPDPSRRQVNSHVDPQLQVLQENAFADSDPQMMQAMFSPSVSAMSYQGQVESSGFVLPPSSTGSISGDLGNLAISQGPVWPGQQTAAQTSTAMSFTHTIQSPVGVRRRSQHSAFSQGMHGQMAVMPQDGMQANVSSQIPYLPSQSPELAAGPVGVPSRTSSRATMSGYTSGSSAAAHRTPFTSTGHSGSVHMLRQYSSGVSSTHYIDGASSSMSPTSPILNFHGASPVLEYQYPEDYSEYINLDQ